MAEFKIPNRPPKRRYVRKIKPLLLDEYLNINIPDTENVTLVELNHYHKNYLHQKQDYERLAKKKILNNNIDRINFETILYNAHLVQLSKFIQEFDYAPRQLFLTFRKFRLDLINQYDPLSTNIMLQYHLSEHKKRFPLQKCQQKRSLPTTFAKSTAHF